MSVLDLVPVIPFSLQILVFFFTSYKSWNCYRNQYLELHGRHKAKASIEEENKRATRVHVRKEKWEYKILIFFSNLCGLLFWLKLVCSLWIVLEKKNFLLSLVFILFYFFKDSLDFSIFFYLYNNIISSLLIANRNL
jgi:hypothetical protein